MRRRASSSGSNLELGEGASLAPTGQLGRLGGPLAQKPVNLDRCDINHQPRKRKSSREANSLKFWNGLRRRQQTVSSRRAKATLERQSNLTNCLLSLGQSQMFTNKLAP